MNINVSTNDLIPFTSQPSLQKRAKVCDIQQRKCSCGVRQKQGQYRRFTGCLCPASNGDIGGLVTPLRALVTCRIWWTAEGATGTLTETSSTNNLRESIRDQNGPILPRAGQLANPRAQKPAGRTVLSGIISLHTLRQHWRRTGWVRPVADRYLPTASQSYVRNGRLVDIDVGVKYIYVIRPPQGLVACV